MLQQQGKIFFFFIWPCSTHVCPNNSAIHHFPAYHVHTRSFDCEHAHMHLSGGSPCVTGEDSACSLAEKSVTCAAECRHPGGQRTWSACQPLHMLQPIIKMMLFNPINVHLSPTVPLCAKQQALSPLLCHARSYGGEKSTTNPC